MRQIFNTVLLSLSLVSFCLNAAPTTEQVEFFEKKIRPVLAEHCYECHNSSGKEKGGLVLDWAGGLAEGGDSGSLLDEDEPLKSFLLQLIRHLSSKVF